MGIRFTAFTYFNVMLCAISLSYSGLVRQHYIFMYDFHNYGNQHLRLNKYVDCTTL